MASNLLRKVMDFLLATNPETVADQAVIDAAIAAVARGMRGSENTDLRKSQDEEAASTSTTDANYSPPVMAKTSPYYGLGLREAAPKFLGTLPPKSPKWPREIWDALSAEGFVSAHKDPVRNVHAALRRREKVHGDVLLVGEGKWGRKDWYTEHELEEIRKSVGGMGGRDKAAHVEATKAGMREAAKRGAMPGVKTKFTSSQIREIEHRIGNGESIRKMAADYGVTAQTIYVRYPREERDRLKAEARQRKQEAEKERPSSEGETNVIYPRRMHGGAE